MTVDEKNKEVAEMLQDIESLKNSYEMYEKEKKKKESLKKKLSKCKKDMEEFDKENYSMNMAKDQAILKIKNGFMCKWALGHF